MPTENRSSNTEMVSVPHGWLYRINPDVPGSNWQFTQDAEHAERLAMSENVEYVKIQAEQHQGEPAAWSPVKPSAPGAYWVRGNGLDQDALIQVIDDHGELRCNLHQRTTESDFGWGYAVADLNEGFEWRGPLYSHADAGEVERLRAEVKRLDLLVAQADYNYDEDRASFKRQLAERDDLLGSAKSALCHLLHNIKISGKRIDLGLAKDSADTVITLINALQAEAKS